MSHAREPILGYDDTIKAVMDAFRSEFVVRLRMAQDIRYSPSLPTIDFIKRTSFPQRTVFITMLNADDENQETVGDLTYDSHRFVATFILCGNSCPARYFDVYKGLRAIRTFLTSRFFRDPASRFEEPDQATFEGNPHDVRILSVEPSAQAALDAQKVFLGFVEWQQILEFPVDTSTEDFGQFELYTSMVSPNDTQEATEWHVAIPHD